MGWRDQAARLTVNFELFFPVGNMGPAPAQIEGAKAVCATCAVLDVCLKWTLDNNQGSGVRGDTSEDERRALKWRNVRQRRASSI